MQEGRVRFFREDRHYGFVVFETNPGSGSFNGEAYFHSSVLRSRVELGDWVQCELEEDPRVQGRYVCTSVELVERQTGIVVEVSRGCYQIKAEATGVILFAPYNRIVPDLVHRTRIPIGSKVTFRLSDPDKKVLDIQNEDAGDFDLETYVEEGIVEFFNAPGGYGHIRRVTRETISFLTKNIMSDNVEGLRVGARLRFKVYSQKFAFAESTRELFHRGFAYDIEILADPNSVEEHFLNAPELPLDPRPGDRVQPGHIFSDADRKRSLRELIARG